MTEHLLAGRRMLVVEDEMLVVMLMEDMLSDLGCSSVTSAASVNQAIKLIATQDFDAATLDVNLNGEKSFPVADELALRGVPFVFSTGYRDPGMDGRYAGRPVLHKPIRPQDMVKAFAELFSISSKLA